MPRPQINDADNRLTTKHYQTCKIGIMGDYETVFCDRPLKQHCIVLSVPSLLAHISNIETDGAEKRRDVMLDILIDQKAEIPQFHGATAVVR